MIRDPRELLEGCVEVASLPMIFFRINEAINSPRASVADISKIISEDPGLTARLLRIVNSPLYNFPGKIETISRAVVIVGTQQLRDLALATSVTKLFKGIPPDLVSMESYWQHSVACGLAARILATYRGETNVERFFVAGILHDIGRLLIYTKVEDLAREALGRCNSEGELLYVAEQKVIGFDHAAIGRVLIRAWRLPSSLEEVVAFHHDPRRASRFPVEAGIVHVADILAHVTGLGSSGEPFVPPLDGEAWERVAVSTSVLSPTLDQLERQFSDVMHTILPDSKPLDSKPCAMV